MLVRLIQSLCRSPKLRATILATLGLGLAYKLAIARGLIPSAQDLAALAMPVSCPADERLHALPEGFINRDRPLAKLLPTNFDPTQTSILIEKSQYRLTLYYDRKPVKSYGVVFGDPVGDKRREGDHRTPEGILRIADKAPHPQWSKFMLLDYPNAQSQCKHRRAKQRREIPVWSTIGGEVGIHGVPNSQDLLVDVKYNWTWGCPALKRRDVDELYEVVQGGSIVEVLP
jgi:hypothetical protein